MGLKGRAEGNLTNEIFGIFKFPQLERNYRGDMSLAQVGDWRMIVRKGKVEIGNSG